MDLDDFLMIDDSDRLSDLMDLEEGEDSLPTDLGRALDDIDCQRVVSVTGKKRLILKLAVYNNYLDCERILQFLLARSINAVTTIAFKLTNNDVAYVEIIVTNSAIRWIKKLLISHVPLSLDPNLLSNSQIIAVLSRYIIYECCSDLQCTFMIRFYIDMRFCQITITLSRLEEEILEGHEYPTAIIELKLNDFKLFSAGASYGFIILKLMKLLLISELNMSLIIGVKLKLANNRLRNGRIDIVVDMRGDPEQIRLMIHELRQLCGNAKISSYSLGLLPKNNLNSITFYQKYLLGTEFKKLLASEEIADFDEILI